MDLLYADQGKIYCSQYMEIYIPMTYFEGSSIAFNEGASIRTIGLVYARAFPGGKPGPIQLFNLPVIVKFMVYETKQETIRIRNKSIEVMTLQYMPKAYVLHQSVTKGREVAGAFLDMILAGKIPPTVNYNQVIDLWWRNLEIAGVSYKVPSKIFEMIIASIYRNPHDLKKRYGQYYGSHPNSDGYDYATGNVRSVVKQLSTFSGMVFEDNNSMISNGINNAAQGKEEPESPLEKIIHY